MRCRFLGLFALIGAFPSWSPAATPFACGPWCGNVTATSATSVIHVLPSGATVRWVLSEDQALMAPIYSAPTTADAATGEAVKCTVDGLKPATKYFYGFEVDGTLRPEPNSRGTFTTFPLGTSSFKIAFASCGDFHHADQRAYDAIIAEQPLLFLNMGDLHYSDTNSTNVADYRLNYDGVLNQPNQAALYRNVPFAYVWDDHDFAGNDSDGSAPGRDAARRAYHERVPHYPFGPSDGTIGQAFTIGRVRVIVTDLRSASGDRNAVESTSKTHLGSAQKAWFKQELISAREANFPLILWVSPTPWIGAAGTGDDDWSKYATERREIANFIKANRIANLAILAGDMHGLAFDDGHNSDYADGGGAPLVVLHAAALTASPSYKGGPYSGGAIPGSQQYGVLEITDTGGPSVRCTYSGKRAGEGTKLSYAFDALSPIATGGTASAPAAVESSFVNISARDRIGSADGVTIVGFVISGTAPRTVLIRAIGPGLRALGVTDPLSDPKFTVFRGQTPIAGNDNWGDTDPDQIAATATRVGAFALASASTKDAAAVVTLAPGVYTVVGSSGDGGVGTVLLELYDVR